MTVFRVEKTRDYTVMANHHLHNTVLFLKAKVLLSLMLSLPEDWDYTTKGLAKICKDGVDSICSTVKELEEHGYIIRQRVRNDMEQLTTVEYTILEQPRQSSPKRENPVLDNPILGEPEQENPDQVITNKSIKEISSTDISNPIQSNHYDPQAADRMGMDTRETYREIILENRNYGITLFRPKDKGGTKASANFAEYCSYLEGT